VRLKTIVLTVLAFAAFLRPEKAMLPVANSSVVSLDDRNAPSEPLAIVVNKSNSVDELSSVELRRVFLGDRSHWANGRRITIVMRELGEPERRTILRDVCGMNEDQFQTHMLRGLFTGDILVSPKTLAAPAGVRKFLFNVPGAIGYLRLSDVDSSVKIVRIDKLMPEDKGYKLHVKAEAGDRDE
jgi:ABC-type phosphate transport system substrate-binding protein